MSVPLGTRFRYRNLPSRKGKARRQRLSIFRNKVIEARTEEKKNGWVVTKGDSRKRGTIKRAL